MHYIKYVKSIYLSNFQNGSLILLHTANAMSQQKCVYIIFVHLRLKGGESGDHGENQRFGGGA